MWDRIGEPPLLLPPKHAAIFRRAAAGLSDAVGSEPWEDDWPGIGIVVFDRLTQGQKRAAILEVARSLLDPGVEPSDVTAVLAGTVGAIYRELEGQIETEMDLAEETTLRQMVLEAMEEMHYWEAVNSALEPGDEPDAPPAPDCEDNRTWSELVEDLRTEILDDYDFDMEHHFLDLAPADAEELKRKLNILPDYFVAVVEDPTAVRLAEIRRNLRALLG
jgi:hypothetical protein